MGFIIKIYENIINDQSKGSFGTTMSMIRILIFIKNSIRYNVINKLIGHNSLLHIDDNWYIGR